MSLFEVKNLGKVLEIPSLLFFLIFPTFSDDSAGKVVLKKGSELFVLEREIVSSQKYRFFSLVLGQDQAGWVSYDAKKNGIQLLTNDVLEDKLSFYTADPMRAIYLKLREELEIKVDPGHLLKIKNETPDWDKRLFGDLSDYVPISNSRVIQKADDLALSCTDKPKKKNGEFCHTRQSAISLPVAIIDMIEEVALETSIDAPLIASIIHHETDFRPFLENEHEKELCHSKGTCSDYGWGKGFAQLGSNDSAQFGIEWDVKAPLIEQCSSVINEDCLDKLESYCNQYKTKKLKPYFCPKAAIKAVALKLKSLIPDSITMYLLKGNELIKKDLNPVLKLNKETEIRNRVAAYNRRRARVYNSYTAYFEQNGEFPSEFGEAWSVPRLDSTPSRYIGHGMLTREFINRCYVWNVAGLCGKIPESSLYSSYQSLFRNR